MTEIFGVEVDDLPDGCAPLEVIVIAKALDEHGDVCLYPRQSEGLSHWEAIGMLGAQGRRLESELADGFIWTDEDDDE